MRHHNSAPIPYGSGMESILATPAPVYSSVVAVGLTTQIFTFIGIVVVAWALYNLMSARRQ
jgi:hypothetical protein